MHDIIELAHNVIAGEHHLIVKLQRDIDSRRSAALCSSATSTNGDKAVQARNGNHRHHNALLQLRTPNASG